MTSSQEHMPTARHHQFTKSKGQEKNCSATICPQILHPHPLDHHLHRPAMERHHSHLCRCQNEECHHSHLQGRPPEVCHHSHLRGGHPRCSTTPGCGGGAPRSCTPFSGSRCSRPRSAEGPCRRACRIDAPSGACRRGPTSSTGGLTRPSAPMTTCDLNLADVGQR